MHLHASLGLFVEPAQYFEVSGWCRLRWRYQLATLRQFEESSPACPSHLAQVPLERCLVRSCGQAKEPSQGVRGSARRRQVAIAHNEATRPGRFPRDRLQRCIRRMPRQTQNELLVSSSFALVTKSLTYTYGEYCGTMGAC